MKRIFALILSVIMSFSLAACGGDGGETQQPEGKPVKNPVRSELYDDSGYKLADISYVYDENGRRLSNTTTWTASGDGETDTYTYDENGNVIKKVGTFSYAPDYENVHNYVYDENGRLIKEDYGAEEFYTGYEYDENGHLARQFYMNDGSRNEGYTYQCDADGNVLVETMDWGDGFISTNTYTYDADGKMLNMDYAMNGEVLFSHAYEYDAEGNLTKQGVSVESWKIEGYVVHYYE